MKPTLQKVLKLKKLFDEGYIPTLSQHEVNPELDKSDRLNYLYFTLPVCINFQRSSPLCWQSALKTWNDSETNYLFYPEDVVTKSRNQIQKDLIKHKLGLQLNKHTDIWIKIATTFCEKFDSNPKKFIESQNFDVAKIIETLRKTMKIDFPYLSGAKMANYWLYILTKYTDVKLKNLNLVSIIPDTHVIQSTKVLGLTDKLEGPEIVADLWNNLLGGTNLTPIEMHPVLWNWSRNGFKPEV